MQSASQWLSAGRRRLHHLRTAIRPCRKDRWSHEFPGTVLMMAAACMDAHSLAAAMSVCTTWRRATTTSRGAERLWRALTPSAAQRYGGSWLQRYAAMSRIRHRWHHGNGRNQLVAPDFYFSADSIADDPILHSDRFIVSGRSHNYGIASYLMEAPFDRSPRKFRPELFYGSKLSGRLVLCPTAAGVTLHLMDLESEEWIPCEEIAVLVDKEGVPAVPAILAVCDHEFVFAGSHASVVHWDLTTQQPVRRIPFGGRYISVAKTMLAAAHETVGVRLFDLRSQAECIHILPMACSHSRLQLEMDYISLDDFCQEKQYLFDLRRLDIPLLAFDATASRFHSGVGLLAVSTQSNTVYLCDWRQPVAEGRTLPFPSATTPPCAAEIVRIPLMDSDRLFCFDRQRGSSALQLSFFDFS